jgi:hypothetical protein
VSALSSKWKEKKEVIKKQKKNAKFQRAAKLGKEANSLRETHQQQNISYSYKLQLKQANLRLHGHKLV